MCASVQFARRRIVIIAHDGAAADLRKESRALTTFTIDRRLARRRPVPDPGASTRPGSGGRRNRDRRRLGPGQHHPSVPAATPILMAWVSRIDELPPDDARERLREGLIRSLGTRDARPVAGPLVVRQFRTVSLEPVRWAAGDAIGIVADSTVFADVADLSASRPPASPARCRSRRCPASVVARTAAP